MKHYTELFLGLILAGLILITLAFILITTPAVFGSGYVVVPRVVADSSH